jgi:hypothetical protein
MIKRPSGTRESPNMALQRTRRPRVPAQQTGFGAGRAVDGLPGTGGSPLNARPLGNPK